MIFEYRLPYVLDFSFKGEEFVLINLHLKCCGDGILNDGDLSDEEYMRYNTMELLSNYIDVEYSSNNLLVLGDFNDTFENPSTDNDIFVTFINANEEYIFTDFDIAQGSTNYWSYPEWPSHIDHIIISNEINDNFIYDIQTILIENALSNGLIDYYNYISDHRPIVITIDIP